MIFEVFKESNKLQSSKTTFNSTHLNFLFFCQFTTTFLSNSSQILVFKYCTLRRKVENLARVSDVLRLRHPRRVSTFRMRECSVFGWKRGVRPPTHACVFVVNKIATKFVGNDVAVPGK